MEHRPEVIVHCGEEQEKPICWHQDAFPKRIIQFKMVRAKDIEPGNILDLTGDKYADIAEYRDTIENEYKLVYEVEQETEHCTLIYFDFDAVGFPSNHELMVVRVSI